MWFLCLIFNMVVVYLFKIRHLVLFLIEMLYLYSHLEERLLSNLTVQTSKGFGLRISEILVHLDFLVEQTVFKVIITLLSTCKRVLFVNESHLFIKEEHLIYHCVAISMTNKSQFLSNYPLLMIANISWVFALYQAFSKTRNTLCKLLYLIFTVVPQGRYYYYPPS